MLNLLVICGGKSSEHAVSLQSARSILQHADRTKYRITAILINRQGLWSVLPARAGHSPDEVLGRLADSPALPPLQALGRALGGGGETVVFPALHGPGGEDGSLQGLFESLGLPYVGCDVSSSALGMDKVIMKRLMQALEIPVAPYLYLSRSDYAEANPKVIASVEKLLQYPCFVKPARGGSSIGISRVSSLAELLPAIESAFLYDDKILIEREIVGREIELALLGDEQASCSAPGEFVREPSFFDYRCKYEDQGLRMRIPADVPEQALRKMRRYALAVYREFGCFGLCRADFFLTNEGEVFFNEINTMPGFTAYSMYPSLWAAAGISFPALIDRLVELALSRNHNRRAAEKSARGAGID